MSRKKRRDAGDDPAPAKSGRLGRVHDRAVDAAIKLLAGMPGDRALEQTFRQARDLGSSERREITELVYGLARRRRRVEDLLERAFSASRKKGTLFDEPMLARLKVLTLLAEEGATLEDLDRIDRYAAQRVPGLFERITSGRLPKRKRSDKTELAIRWSVPDWIASRLFNSFGVEKTEALARALFGRAPFTVRANRWKTDRDALERLLVEHHGVSVEPTRHAPDGLILERAVAQDWEEYSQGLFEVQDEGSQLVALATAASPEQLVIDACAGAGGKTLALGAMMGSSGRVVAIDPDQRKLTELKRRARRAGLTNIETHAVDFMAFPESLTGRADCVLVDAPCTGSGTFRRQPDARWRITEADLLRLVEVQRHLLLRAIDAVRPGGCVVYATCSILEEENERVVESVLEAEANRIQTESLSRTWGSDLGTRLAAGSWKARIGPGPDETDPDGFFVSLVVRKKS